MPGLLRDSGLKRFVTRFGIGPRVSTSPVGIYGKSQASSEYLRRRCFAGIADVFRQWVNESFDRASRDPTTPNTLPSPYDLLFVPGNGRDREVLAARIVNSTDRGRERVFPATAFVVLPRRRCVGRGSAGLAWLSPVMDQLGELLGQLETASSSQEVYERVDECEIALPADPGSSQAQPANAFTRVIAEVKPDAVAANDLARSLARTASTWMALQDPELSPHLRPGLPFPVLPGLSAREQAMGWIDLAKERGLRVLSVAIPASGSQGAIWMFARPLDERDFGTLCTINDGSGSPESLTTLSDLQRVILSALKKSIPFDRLIEVVLPGPLALR